MAALLGDQMKGHLVNPYATAAVTMDYHKSYQHLLLGHHDLMNHHQHHQQIQHQLVQQHHQVPQPQQQQQVHHQMQQQLDSSQTSPPVHQRSDTPSNGPDTPGSGDSKVSLQ